MIRLAGCKYLSEQISIGINYLMHSNETEIIMSEFSIVNLVTYPSH